MKSTGIVRRIDELGRIVIPKEIRTNLRIRETDNVEIYVEDESIILKKHSIINSLKDIADNICDSIYINQKKTIIITDTSHIISASMNIKKKVINLKCSEQLLLAIKKRDYLKEYYKKNISITDNIIFEKSYIIKSIISNGDVVGLFILINDEINSQDESIVDLMTTFLSKYLEN